MDILSRSGDIRNQSRTVQKIDRKFACFWPLKFFRGGPPSCPTLLGDSSQISIMWQSFAPIGLGASEMWLSKKHLRQNISPSGTVVPGGPLTSCGAKAQQTPSPCCASRGFSELTKNVIRSSQGHSTPFLEISCKSVLPFSRNLAIKETKKQRNRSKTIPRPPIYRGRGNNSFSSPVLYILGHKNNNVVKIVIL